MKHLVIPEDIRNLLKRACAVTYDAVAADCPEVETYSRRTLTDIILDQAPGFARDTMNFKAEDREKLGAWIKKNFYSDEYLRDAKRVVREVVG